MIPEIRARFFRPMAEKAEIYTPADLHEEHVELKKLIDDYAKALGERQDALRRDHEVLNTKLDDIEAKLERLLALCEDTNKKVSKIYDIIPWLEM